MNFSSDITFKGENGYVIKMVQSHLDEIDNSSDDENIRQPYYKVFMFCSYLGLILDENDRMNLNPIEYHNEEVAFTIPRTTLHVNTMSIKELLICAEFVYSNFDVSDNKLQKIWNIDNLSDVNELVNFIKDRAVLGARYYLNLVDLELHQHSDSEILEDIDARLKKLLTKIDKKIVENKLDEDLLTMEL